MLRYHQRPQRGVANHTPLRAHGTNVAPLPGRFSCAIVCGGCGARSTAYGSDSLVTVGSLPHPGRWTGVGKACPFSGRTMVVTTVVTFVTNCRWYAHELVGMPPWRCDRDTLSFLGKAVNGAHAKVVRLRLQLELLSYVPFSR
jgi:hypothetical protein